MYVWLTIDGKRQGPHLLTYENGKTVLTPADSFYMKDASIEEIANMGIVEMRLA